MYRRRRRGPREIAFSLDSFLDVVANVVGIIIRLILVAWVGARSYHSLTVVPPLAAPAAPAAAVEVPEDPLSPEMAKQRRDLQQLQDRLLEQLRRLQDVKVGNEEAGREVVLLSAKEQELEKEKGAVEKVAQAHGQYLTAAVTSLEDLCKRRERLGAEIKALEKLPSAKHVLRYRTPVSRPVHTEELHFECQSGRVAFVDIAAFLVEIRDGMQDKMETMRTRWRQEEVTGPVGGFRLRYVVERERTALEGVTGAPDPAGPFRVSVSSWVVEPLDLQRGEPVGAALQPTSGFRQIVDVLDPAQSVVTFWVYPDSFPLYRRLRDYLYERGIEVAGRPLPIGYPIASSRSGAVSRGQ